MINNIKIVADSSADCVNFISHVPFESVPLKIIAGEKEFVDDKNLKLNDMVKHLAKYKGKSSTACPSVMEYVNAFEDSDNVICITITAKLSGSYNAACIAKTEVKEKHPDKKIYVINSLSAGPELKLLIEKAIELIDADVDFYNICKKLEEYKNSTGLTFSLESLNNLSRNGRVNPIVAKAAGLLGIRIVGKASDKGDLQALDKPRGEEKAYAKVFERMISEGYNGGKVRIDHCGNIKAAQTLEALIKKRFKKADVITDITYGLCSFYAEDGGILVGFEK